MKRFVISTVILGLSCCPLSAPAMDATHQQQFTLNWLGQPVLTPAVSPRNQNNFAKQSAQPTTKSVLFKQTPALTNGFVTRTEPSILDLSQTRGTERNEPLISSRPSTYTVPAMQTQRVLRVPSTIDQLAGGKLQLFKRVDVRCNTKELYMVRGEVSDNLDLKTYGPYLRIKLNPAYADKNLMFDVQTEWKIRAVNRGIMLVDDPRIEFIELRKNSLEVSSFVWDLSIALDNAVQIKCADGSIIEKQPLGGLALRF